MVRAPPRLSWTASEWVADMGEIRVHGEQAGPAVTLGLLAPWALDDAEELATGPRRVGENLPALRERFSGVPEPVWGAMAAV